MWLESALLFEKPPEIFARVFRELKPRTVLPQIRIEFRRFANANSFIRLEGESFPVRITDILEGAPAPIIEALAYILLSKLYRRPVPRVYADRYRRYLNRKEMRRCLHLVRQERGRKLYAAPKGRYHDLEEMFEKLNFEHFHGSDGPAGLRLEPASFAAHPRPLRPLAQRDRSEQAGPEQCVGAAVRRST